MALALGDNIFYGHGLPRIAAPRGGSATGATVFGYRVRDPERYGVVEFDAAGRAVGLEEKPRAPALALRGHRALLLRPPGASTSRARSSRRRAASWRSPTSTSSTCAAAPLHVEKLGRGIAWLDTGTHESLLQASNFIQAIEERQGLKVGLPRGDRLRMGYIDAAEAARLAEPHRQDRLRRSTCCGVIEQEF